MSIRRVWASFVASLLFVFAPIGQAQRPAARLSGSIGGGAQVIPGSRPPRATAAADIGALSGDAPISGITLVLNRSAAQEAALQTLLAAQQNPASPLYHQWLTPESFGAQFGVADADLAKVESWLQSQGFTVGGLTRARDRITFSGTAAQVNAAFGTSMHRYQNGSRVENAPSSDLSLPATLAPMVTAVLHLSTFRPHSMVKRAPSGATADYTTANNAEHFLTPSDVATMYDVNATYNSGFTGAGQMIAIAGETFIQLSDVSSFQTASGLTANLPTLVLEPNTGGSATYEGDEFESDIDVEYATGMAPGANVLLVYTGDSPYYGVFDAFDYAIEENLAPVVSVSYGSCEQGFGQAAGSAGNALFEQAASQGQTLIASAGDQGSTACYGYTDTNGDLLPYSNSLAINYPADSPNVTAIGGTQMAAGTFGAGTSPYWASAGTTPVVNSLLSYVPEVVWNEDSAMYGIASGTGGASILFPAPTWQAGNAGIPGIPSTNTARLNPDISLLAAVSSPGYLACSSDPSSFQTGQTNSCANGAYDTTKKFVTLAGGTSFGAPIFAGLMAVLNQVKHGTGQGAVNSTVYGLAANSATYGSVFHDVTSGNNECTALGAAHCTAGLTEFVAGTGYDEASGLGSIDFGNMLAAWPVAAANSLAGTSTVLTAATLTPASGASDVITITVTSAGSTPPTGTVQVYVADAAAPTYSTVLSTTGAATLAATLTLTNGQATYTFPGTTTGGTQLITATYSGSTANSLAASTGTIALTLANTQVPVGGFTFTVGSVTVPANGVGQSVITVTPTGGYNGLINFALPTLPATDCFATDYSAISGTTQFNLYVGNGTSCTSGAAVRVGNHMVVFPKRTALLTTPAKPSSEPPLEGVLAGVLMLGFVSTRRKRQLPRLLNLAILLSLVAGLSLGLSGCGGSSAPTPPTTPITPVSQTLSLTLMGTDSVTTSITNTAPLTVTIQ